MKRAAGLRGKAPAEHLDMGTLNDYIRVNLPKPPASFDYSNKVADYPMALNDTYGDCTIAGVIHMLQLIYAEIGETFEYPGDEAIKEKYFKLSGGADTGLVERQVLQTWMTEGFFGNKISAYAPVNIKNRTEMATAIYLFGSVYLGVEMPANAEQQFENHEPWHLVSEDPQQPVGGHCVVATGCNRFGLDIITWGATESMTWGWWEEYGSEAWVVIPEIFTEIDHGPVWSINILALQQDLKNLDN
jgi:hypothetical protein